MKIIIIPRRAGKVMLIFMVNDIMEQYPNLSYIDVHNAVFASYIKEQRDEKTIKDLALSTITADNTAACGESIRPRLTDHWRRKNKRNWK